MKSHRNDFAIFGSKIHQTAEKGDTEDTKDWQSNNIFAKNTLTIEGERSYVRMDKRWKKMKSVKGNDDMEAHKTIGVRSTLIFFDK